MSFNLIFDVALRENCVDRRGSGEECKRQEGSRSHKHNKRLDDGLYMRDVQRDGRHRHLNDGVRGGAESAIRVVNVVRVGVDDLNGSADNDEHDAQKGEQQPPRTL